MKLYRKKVIRNMDENVRQLKAASGIKGNKVPHGFGAVAGFDFGNIYVDDRLHKMMDSSLSAQIDECLSKMARDNYGDISPSEADTNCENKYFGNGKDLTGRYHISAGTIEIHIDDDTRIRLK